MEPPKTFAEWTRKLVVREKTGVSAEDEQTGKSFELLSETIWDVAAAIVSVLYLFATLVFLCWALFDVYHGQNQVLQYLLSKETILPDSPLSRLIAYAVIGGGLGGVVNGFRSIIVWHSERQAFGWRYAWKYITLPPLGALLAAMVYALVQSGMAVLGGNFVPDENAANQALSAFGIGALAGYGSHKVFIWLDWHVNRWFSTAKAEEERVDSSNTGEGTEGGDATGETAIESGGPDSDAEEGAAMAPKETGSRVEKTKK